MHLHLDSRMTVECLWKFWEVGREERGKTVWNQNQKCYQHQCHLSSRIREAPSHKANSWLLKNTNISLLALWCPLHCITSLYFCSIYNIITDCVQPLHCFDWLQKATWYKCSIKMNKDCSTFKISVSTRLGGHPHTALPWQAHMLFTVCSLLLSLT